MNIVTACFVVFFGIAFLDTALRRLGLAGPVEWLVDFRKGCYRLYHFLYETLVKDFVRSCTSLFSEIFYSCFALVEEIGNCFLWLGQLTVIKFALQVLFILVVLLGTIASALWPLIVCVGLYHYFIVN